MSNKPSRLPYVLAVLAAITIVSAAWLSRNRIRPVIAGERAPEFVVQDAAGNDVTLADYQDKVILLNIWATWCAPCRAEMPSMERLYQQFPGEDFEVVAISVDAPEGQFDAFGYQGGDPDRFAKEIGTTFTILRNPGGEIRRTYQTTGVPESFLIGRDGVIYKKVAGETRWDTDANADLVRRLLEGQ